MTALSGRAREFIQLAIPRIFVGVGEATLTPASISMLGDAFPPRRLGLAVGIYYAGIPLGLALAHISSSFIAPTSPRTHFRMKLTVGMISILPA